jgi:hypothetical protein
MGLSGVAYLIQGWVIGTSGFSAANQAPTLLGIILVALWSVWLFVTSLRLKANRSAETDAELTR